jgi:hypothetical protein
MNELGDAAKDVGKKIGKDLGDEVSEQLTINQKIGKGIRDFVDLTPGGLIPGSDRGLRAIGSAFEAMSPEIAGATLALGGFVALVGGAVVSLNVMASHMKQLELDDRIKQKVGVTFDTADIDGQLEKLKRELGSRVKKELQVD